MDTYSIVFMDCLRCLLTTYYCEHPQTGMVRKAHNGGRVCRLVSLSDLRNLMGPRGRLASGKEKGWVWSVCVWA